MRIIEVLTKKEIYLHIFFPHVQMVVATWKANSNGSLSLYRWPAYIARAGGA